MQNCDEINANFIFEFAINRDHRAIKVRNLMCIIIRMNELTNIMLNTKVIVAILDRQD